MDELAPVVKMTEKEVNTGLEKRRILAFLAIALLALLATSSVFAAVPSPAWDMHTTVDTGANTLTWHLTNLTDGSSSFALVRVDWLYPDYDVSNVAPTLPWAFAKHQLAPDDWTGGYSTTAVSWITSIANGLGNGDSMDFTILSGPPVVEQEPFPLHMVWARLAANTPRGEPTTIDIGVVPEPGSLLVLLSGMSGLGAIAWKRRRK